jgi:2-polyprenyl-6-methoxyphenol hydroxylase-like FAD-dependent oxidoreductase
VQASLVVGADGRASTVRKQIGVTLEKEEPVNYLCGLLLDDLHDVPTEFDFLAGEGDLFYVFFHQGNGRARAYLATGLLGQHQFAGADRVATFQDAWRAASSFPWGEQVAAATPAGPIATYPGDDTWTPTPFADGVVLVGDAAGYNDPIIGQGLSIAMRDARTVRDLILDGARTPDAFTSYAGERMARMKRLRYIADVISVAMSEDCGNRQARRAFLAEKMGAMDPEVMGLMAGAFAGPELVPDELMATGLLERIRAA